LYLLGTKSVGGALFFFFASLAFVFLVEVVVVFCVCFLAALGLPRFPFLAVRPAR